MTKGLTLDALPAFASDEAIAVALMGTGKAGEWRQIVSLLEERGLPKIDHLMGGRYVPAVKAFFDREYNLTAAPPIQAKDGPEDWSWKPKRQARRV